MLNFHKCFEIVLVYLRHFRYMVYHDQSEALEVAAVVLPRRRLLLEIPTQRTYKH